MLAMTKGRLMVFPEASRIEAILEGGRMVLEMNHVVMDIDYRGVLPVDHASGARVACLSGRIWITEQNASEDVVLEAGEAYEIVRDGLVVVQALRAAIVDLRAPARAAAEPLATRLSPFLGRSAATRPVAPV
jgi:hypothetical protein